MRKIQIQNFAKIKEAEIILGDLTVFIGPQATGKTLVLELIKLIEDKLSIARNLKKHGFEWKDNKGFLSLYFGEGLNIVWNEQITKVVKDGRRFNLTRTGRVVNSEKVFYIPAQRVLTLEDGWPKAFNSFGAIDPYVVKKFSEEIRILLERMGDFIFPIEGRMSSELRKLLNQSIFWSARLAKSTKEMKRRLTLTVGTSDLPFMVWSAGQREFIPLLLGFYWLMPSGRVEKRKGVEIAIIEEPEMGLHPKALESVMITILDLLRRDYKVIISTHSSQILEMIWSINTIKSANGDKYHLRRLFEVDTPSLDKIWQSVLDKKYKVFYFKPQLEHIEIKDISSLDILDNEDVEQWGELISFATRASNIVSDVISQ